MTNKEYWLYIDPKTYCSLKPDSALLYNTANGGAMKVHCGQAIELLRSLHEPENLGCILLLEDDFSDKDMQEFLSEFCGRDYGGMLRSDQVTQRPVQMIPILNLQRDLDRRDESGEGVDAGDKIFHYLLQLNLYLNEECSQTCRLCDSYHRQCLCCRKSERQLSLDFDSLTSLLAQLRHSSVGLVNILGGDPLKYARLAELHELLQTPKRNIHLWNHYANFAPERGLFTDFTYDVIVTMPVEKSLLKRCLESLKAQAAGHIVHLYVASEQEYDLAEQLTEELAVEDNMVHPVFTGTNSDFFHEFVYRDEEDILSPPLSFRQIFAHQKLNTNHFGTLSVMPGGEIHADITGPSLGNIARETMLETIHKELLSNTVWRQIRQGAPCNECHYRFLCPSPSGYETFIGKPNLCNIM